jgi:hypothetical protein
MFGAVLLGVLVGYARLAVLHLKRSRKCIDGGTGKFGIKLKEFTPHRAYD